ncbi:GNAT family N-acetyltransferase [Spongisporangium articulatum]|uniref:GNAT family N-acetyltransferase n=1 Tax=Spongisporangium articulatum TaxID=3362603 RepID=A0ABW8AQL2_9ACTN
MSEHLTHGWEPDLADDDSLLRAYVRGNAVRTCAMAERGGGRAARWDEVTAADPRSPFVFDNMAVLLQPPEYVDLPSVVARLEAFYPPERHYCFLSPFPTPDLRDYGWHLMGHPPVMLRPAGGSAPPPPPELRLEPVDAANVEVFLTTLVEAYPVPSAPVAQVAPAWLADDLKLFIGYVGDEPVGTAGARLGHGIVDVEWVSTYPRFRGRGYGAALTWAATLASPGDPAMLIASDDGQPVYERMGYLRLLRMTLWHRPPR